ncbi:MAG: hypothetical protein ABI675_18050 [Chitinophagaceae bacterium]
MQQLTDFYEAIADDLRIGTSHICVYIALLHVTDPAESVKAIEIDRNTVMKNAKISRKTYNKCLSELQEYGYIKYEPSLNPLVASKVYLNRL